MIRSITVKDYVSSPTIFIEGISQLAMWFDYFTDSISNCNLFICCCNCSKMIFSFTML